MPFCATWTSGLYELYGRLLKEKNKVEVHLTCSVSNSSGCFNPLYPNNSIGKKFMTTCTSGACILKMKDFTWFLQLALYIAMRNVNGSAQLRLKAGFSPKFGLQLGLGWLTQKNRVAGILIQKLSIGPRFSSRDSFIFTWAIVYHIVIISFLS